ncbi:hypothetical protein PP427_gp251 [Salmonella phage KM16]|nr:hypothetical protein PP427_gp251 [Salmonella phage KM16]
MRVVQLLSLHLKLNYQIALLK